MYNRYTPKQDGSYQKDRMPEAQPRQASQPPPAPIQEQPCAQQVFPDHQAGKENAIGFLSGLLPKNMDTGDLLMLLILLLLLNDGSEDAPSALLTIALFFLMN